jgi:very-short-patch-repair endonuclease
MPTEVDFDRHMGDQPQHDAQVAEIASRQHGMVAHRQLTAIGLRKDAIHHRVQAGRLHRLHRGVYAVGHRQMSVRGRWMAATLAWGPGALLSHRDGAALWQILPSSRRLIDVTVPTPRGKRPGILLHHARDLDRSVVDRIPVTTVARTLVDIAGVVRFDQLQRAIEAAARRDLLDLRDLERLMTPGRRGVPALRAALRDYYDPGFTRSEFERRFARLCRDADLPPPFMNMWIDDQEVDAVWEAERVAVQLDSYEFHRTRAAFERDRRRQAALQLRNYRVLPVTYRWLKDDPDQVVTAVRSLLARDDSPKSGPAPARVRPPAARAPSPAAPPRTARCRR